MTIQQSQTVSLGECALPSNLLSMYPSEDDSLFFALSVDDYDYYDDDQMMMIDDGPFEEDDADSLSATEEILSILDRAIAVCDDIGLAETPLDNQQNQTVQTSTSRTTRGEGSAGGPLFPHAEEKIGSAPEQ